MPGPVHEMMVSLLGEHPEWIDALLQALGLGSLPGGLVRDDSTIHLVDPLEMRPDLLLLAKGSRGPWLAVEAQLDGDPDKLLF